MTNALWFVPWVSAMGLVIAALSRDWNVWNPVLALVAAGAFLTALINIQAGESYIAWNVVAAITAVVAGRTLRRIYPKKARNNSNLFLDDPRLAIDFDFGDLKL